MKNKIDGLRIFAARCYHFTRCLVYCLMALFKPIKVIDYKKIPIIINNRNRYTFLLKLIESLACRGYTNIIILDNDSSYPPLLKYYETCPYRIYRLNKNLGYLALMKCDLYNEVAHNYFVYTDPDVVPIEECPEDFLDYFLSLLKRDPFLEKVGFSLKIDDLPDCFHEKEKVINWEKKYYETVYKPGIYSAPIDTTFALHRPWAKISLSGTYKNYRIGFPYEARHLPWYVDSQNISDEDVFYKKSASIGGHWTNGKL